jgi:hypothetical protein
MELNWRKLIGKRAHLVLNNNFEYNCLITSVDVRSEGLVFIEILDKFNKRIIFTSGEIKFIEVKE